MQMTLICAGQHLISCGISVIEKSRPVIVCLNSDRPIELSPSRAPFAAPAPPEKDPIHEHHVRGLELKLLYAGPRALTTSEKRELLLSAESIRRLRPETAGKEVPAPR